MKTTQIMNPVKLPFPLSMRTTIRIEKLRELCNLHGQAIAVAEKFEELCEEESKMVAADIAQEILTKYNQPLRKLEMADRWAVEKNGEGFLSAEERELVYYRFSDKETLLELWEDEELNGRDGELLAKYKDAANACITGDDGDDFEYDYSEVCRLARLANEKVSTPVAVALS